MSGMSFAALAARNAANPAPVQAPLPASNISAAAPAPPAAVVDAEPSEARTLFARGVIYTFDTWSVLQSAVKEEWGGPESQDKADYLLNAVVDYFDDFSAPAEAASAQATGKDINVQVPDEEEVWEILEGYIVAEYGAQVEDDSTLNVARRMIALWKQVFLAPASGTQPLQQAQETVEALKRVREQVKGTKTIVTRQEEEAEWSDSDDEGHEEHVHDHHPDHVHADGDDREQVDHMDVDPPPAKAEPKVDDDGFTTVPTRRRK